MHDVVAFADALAIVERHLASYRDDGDDGDAEYELEGCTWPRRGAEVAGAPEPEFEKFIVAQAARFVRKHIVAMRRPDGGYKTVVRAGSGLACTRRPAFDEAVRDVVDALLA